MTVCILMPSGGDHSHLEAVRARPVGHGDETLDRPLPNLITRAIGGNDTLELEVDTIDGDVFLLCNDGLSNEVNEQAIEQALLPGQCRLASKALIDLALARGGRGNITAVVVQAEDLHNPDRTALLPVI